MEGQFPFDSEKLLEAVRRKHSTGLLTLLFTDIVGSTALKQRLGDRAAADLFHAHHELIRTTLSGFPQSQEIETAGDSFLLVFATPSNAVEFALQVQAQLRALLASSGASALDRIGIHVGEVVIGQEADRKLGDLFGIQIDICSRVMSLAVAGQILMSRAVFDSARQLLKGEDLAGIGLLAWLNHGPYLLKGLDEAVEICEVREQGQQTSEPPAVSEKVQRQLRAGEEPVLGWRPAIGQPVPGTRWVLEKKLGEGGFGEVWLGRQQQTKERRVFKFCFQTDRVRFLKRELTLFRLLKERIGDHPNIVRLHDVYLDRAPYYVEMDYVEGADLRSWMNEQGGIASVPLETRLEIVSQAAEGLQAAHEAGVIHRDMKPTNILVKGNPSIRRADGQSGAPARPPIAGQLISVKLSDFGIGQVVSREYLEGITRAGFTETLLADSSSSRSGTQMYMAPELMAGKPATIRSDIYALGVVLYQLLVCDFARPLTTDWAQDISDPILRDDLRQCFAGNPQDRFAGAGQLAKNLRDIDARRAEMARRDAEKFALERAAYRRGMIRMASVAGLVVALIASLAVFALRQSALAKRQARRAQSEELNKSRLLYAAEMNLAKHALAAGNTRWATTLLERYLPKTGVEDVRGFEWRYLWQLKQGNSRFTLNVHRTNAAIPTAFSPDGRFLAVGGTPLVQFFDLQSQRVAKSLQGHSAVVRSLAFSLDGRRFSSEDVSNSVIMWDLASGKPTATLPPAIPDDENALALAFFPDGETVAISRGHIVKLWNVATGKELLTLPEHESDVLSLAISADGKILALGDVDGRVKLWDLEARRIVGLLPTMTFGPVFALAFSPDKRTLGASTFGGEAILWDVKTQATIGSMFHAGWVTGVAFSPDGKFVATASDDQTAKLWISSSQKLVRTFKGHTAGVNSVSFSKDGKRLATGSSDGTARLWDTAETEEDVLRGHHGAVNRLAFSPVGTLLATGDIDGTLKLWSLTNGAEVAELLGHTNWIFGIAISPDGKTLASAGGVWHLFKPGELKVWDMATRKSTPLVGHTGCVYSVNFSPDSKLLVSGANDQTLRIWDVATHRQMATIALGTNSWLNFGMLSPDGQTVLSVSPLHALALWEVSSGKRLATLEDSTLGLCADFSRDGKLLAIGKDWGAGIDLWDMIHHKLEATLKGHLGAVNSVAFSPDGRTLASSGHDGTVRLWSLLSRQEVLTLEGHSNVVAAVAFSPDGNVLATAGGDKTVRLWRAAPHQ